MNILKKFFGNEESEKPANNSVKTDSNTVEQNVVEETNASSSNNASQSSSSSQSSDTQGVQENVSVSAAEVHNDVKDAVSSTASVNNEPTSSSEDQPSVQDADDSQKNEEGEPDMKVMLKKSMINWESTYRNQHISMTDDIQFPRSSFTSYVKVRDVIETLYPSLKDKFTGRNYLSKVSEDVLSTGTSEKLGDVLEVSPFAFVFKKEGENQLTVLDESFAMTLEYKGANDKLYYLNLFVKVLGQAEHSVYLRVTTMKSAEVADDMITCRSNSLPECYSAVMVYDVLDASEDIKFFEETVASAKKKMQAQEELDQFEVEAVNGIYGMHLPPYNYGFANWLFEKERYYDAYVMYERVYNALKPSANSLDKESREVFLATCFHMGACLQQWGELEKACYFFELASSAGVNEYIGAYVNILALLSHNRVYYFLNQVRSQADKNEAAKNETTRLESLISNVEKHYTVPETYNSGVLTLGYVLNRMFDVDPRCILGATINHTGDNDIAPQVVSNADAWNLNIYDLKDSVLYVRYSRAQWQTKVEEDKSILCFDNAIMVDIHSAVTEDGKSCVRVNAMIPNFSRNDEKREFNPCNLPITGSFAMGDERPDKVFTNDQLKDVYEQAVDLLGQRRIFEAMQGFDYIHRALKIEYTKAEATDETEELFFEATFQLGFCLVELGIYEKATYYLDWAQEGNKAEYAQEYINCMCNNNDVRALAAIESQLKVIVKPEEPEYQQAYEFHKSFLLRRKAYVLINWHMFDDAENLLKEMLNDPNSKEYAEHELECIKQMREQQN